MLTFKDIISKGLIEHISSPHILREVEAVLVERMNLTKQKAKAATRLLERQSRIVPLPTNIEQICRDPFDDYILAAALAGKARYIITADKDLLVLEAYKGITIIKPDGFHKIIRP